MEEKSKVCEQSKKKRETNVFASASPEAHVDISFVDGSNIASISEKKLTVFWGLQSNPMRNITTVGTVCSTNASTASYDPIAKKLWVRIAVRLEETSVAPLASTLRELDASGILCGLGDNGLTLANGLVIWSPSLFPFHRASLELEKQLNNTPTQKSHPSFFRSRLS